MSQRLQPGQLTGWPTAYDVLLSRIVGSGEMVSYDEKVRNRANWLVPGNIGYRIGDRDVCPTYPVGGSRSGENDCKTNSPGD